MAIRDLEIPLGKRKPLYRFFEILPGALSYFAIVLLVILSFINETVAAVYLLIIVMTVLVKAVAVAIRISQGYSLLKRVDAVNWSNRLQDLEDPQKSYERLYGKRSKSYGSKDHVANLRKMITEKSSYPRPSEVYNAVIVAAFNETEEVLEPTIEAVRNTNYDNSRIIMVFAYEERGGDEVAALAERLKEKYSKVFFDFITVEHKDGIKGEVIGKGANLVSAGRALSEYLKRKKIASDRVIVTTLDSDNRPAKQYFDCMTYEFIVRENRERLSYQPVALFLNNIWDAPAPARVIATGNSFWHLTSSMRPHSLRNFASHSQPMSALEAMDFWSVRTIVEDGHQYWRSLFHCKGDYEVIPIRIPVYQDAVLSDTLWKTLKAQFVQLRRWYYGASDVAYVGVELCSKKRRVSFWELLPKFIRLLDSHVTLAVMAPVVAFGGWIPSLVNSLVRPESVDMLAYELPGVVSVTQFVAMLGLFVTVLVSIRLLPKRPERYKKKRTIMMVLQWILMPVTSMIYSSFTAFYSQTRLMTGKYMEKFDVTEKVVKK